MTLQPATHSIVDEDARLTTSFRSVLEQAKQQGHLTWGTISQSRIVEEQILNCDRVQRLQDIVVDNYFGSKTDRGFFSHGDSALTRNVFELNGSFHKPYYEKCFGGDYSLNQIDALVSTYIEGRDAYAGKLEKVGKAKVTYLSSVDFFTFKAMEVVCDKSDLVRLHLKPGLDIILCHRLKSGYFAVISLTYSPAKEELPASVMVEFHNMLDGDPYLVVTEHLAKNLKLLGSIHFNVPKESVTVNRRMRTCKLFGENIRKSHSKHNSGPLVVEMMMYMDVLGMYNFISLHDHNIALRNDIVIAAMRAKHLRLMSVIGLEAPRDMHVYRMNVFNILRLTYQSRNHHGLRQALKHDDATYQSNKQL